MQNIVPLDSVQHRHLRLARNPAALPPGSQRFVQVVLSELVLLAADLPILFSKDAETGGFYCGAMRGIDPGEDLFTAANNCAAPPPLSVQREGFYVGAAGLGVELSSPRLSTDADGDPLFGDDGQPAECLQAIVAALKEFRSGVEQTQDFIRTLLELKLIEPVDIGLSFDDGTRRDIEGLYTISQDRLRALPDAAVLDLFRRDYLKPIHAIIISFRQVHRLAWMKNDKLAGGPAMIAGLR
jgi:hypothetical protein